VVRLNANGSLDTGFGTNGQSLIDLRDDIAYSVVTQADGKILIAGTTTAQPAGVTGTSKNYGVVRLNANGSRDTSFGTNGQALLDLGSNTDDDARSMVAQADGKILIAGTTAAQPPGATGTFSNYGVVRLNADGSRDTSFGTNGQTLLDLGSNTIDEAYSMVTQADGKILIAGGSMKLLYGVVRLNADGTLDTTFAPVSSLDGKASYVIGAPAVRLDNDVRLNDPDLATLNSGAGNYAGTRLVLQRDGGASANDRFAGTGKLQLEAPAAAGQPGRVLLGSTTLNATAVRLVRTPSPAESWRCFSTTTPPKPFSTRPPAPLGTLSPARSPPEARSKSAGSSLTGTPENKALARKSASAAPPR
jgi:uncharacterized delta-60 repeat protein